jgi:3-oxoacyl-[acyl-carrier-protein] synthase II
VTVAVVAHDLFTAFGRGASATWDGLLAGRPAFSTVEHFSCDRLGCGLAALAPLSSNGPSRLWALLEPLLLDLAPQVPAGCEVFLATTTGEIDRLERHVEQGAGRAEDSRPEALLQRVCATLDRPGPGRVVAAACASSTIALALAAEDVARDRCEAALVVAGDAVTEFVYSGFASLLALDPEGARPFDRHRRGLTLGDGAALALLMDERRARLSGRKVLGRVTGWGMSCDANHMTGPARDGSGLAHAVRSALARAAQPQGGIGSICAHGTGTPFNDAMELRAFRAALGEALPPVYSVKGAVGHTLGAAGLVEVIVGLESLRHCQVPPSVNLREPDADAEGVVSAQPRPQAPDAAVLSTNSGFGGINAAVVLRTGEAVPA